MTSTPLRIGLIGAGNVARQHLLALARTPELQPVAIASRTVAKAQALADEFVVGQVFATPAEMVAAAKPDALMVLVSVEHMAPVTLQCLEFGLPLFLEKPVGLSSAEGLTVAEAARDKAVACMVGYNRRHYSIFARGLARVLERGRLLAVHVEGSERMNVVRGLNRFPEEVLRGWIFANATHTIDLLRHFGGEPEVVHALCASLSEPRGDQFAACLRFPGGITGSYTANWLSPGGWGVTLKGVGVTAEFKPLETCRLSYADGTTETLEADEDDRAVKPGFCGQLRAFAQMVRTGRLAAPSQDLFGALQTMRLAETLCADPVAL